MSEGLPVSRASPFVVILSESDRAALEQQVRSYTSPHAEVIRAKIVLFAAGGQANAAIAQRLDVHVDVVSRWRKRFCAQGLAGLTDRARSGRPRSFAAGVVAEVKAMACEPPTQREVPLPAGARPSWPEGCREGRRGRFCDPARRPPNGRPRSPPPHPSARAS